MWYSRLDSFWPTKKVASGRTDLLCVRAMAGRQTMKHCLVRFQVLTAASMKFRFVFWDVQLGDHELASGD
jgi:hypothetical protein